MLGTTQSNQPGEQKVLGVRWDVAKDQFCFGFIDIAHSAAELEPTKRNLISIVGRFYDPIGFLAPIVIKFKILLQELSERKIDWDKPLSGDLLRKWETLVTDLQSNPPMSLPRCIWAVGTVMLEFDQWLHVVLNDNQEESFPVLPSLIRVVLLLLS